MKTIAHDDGSATIHLTPKEFQRLKISQAMSRGRKWGRQQASKIRLVERLEDLRIGRIFFESEPNPESS